MSAIFQVKLVKTQKDLTTVLGLPKIHPTFKVSSHDVCVASGSIHGPDFRIQGGRLGRFVFGRCLELAQLALNQFCGFFRSQPVRDF